MPYTTEEINSVLANGPLLEPDHLTPELSRMAVLLATRLLLDANRARLTSTVDVAVREFVYGLVIGMSLVEALGTHGLGGITIGDIAAAQAG